MLLVLAALAVLEPDGWIKDSSLGRPIAGLGLETASYHAPSDPQTMFIAFRTERAVPAIDMIVDQLHTETFAPVSRTHRVERGVEIDELVLEAPDGARLHVRETSGRSEMIGGLCVARGASLAACEERLARISAPPYAAVNTDGISDVLYLIGAAVVALSALVLGVRYVLRRRDLAKSPPLVDGDLVTIAGTVRAIGHSLEAPLSGTRCVAHRSHAQAFTEGRTRDVVAEAVESEAIPFIVETRHGAIRIDERALEMALAPSGLVDRPTPRLLAFRERHRVATDAPANFDEIVIQPGAKVALRGVVKLERQPDASAERGYRDDAPATLRLVSLPQQPLTVLRVW